MPVSGNSQDLNYPEIFGDDWTKALQFESENRNWMEPILVKNHISYPLAVAVVFPELVRYSALRDKMEITLLKALYINLGDNYANFSIGQFQMKPSFAEMICEQANSVLNRRSGIRLKRRWKVCVDCISLALPSLHVIRACPACHYAASETSSVCASLL